MARIVLVADDSLTIQRRAAGILKGGGFEVETVSNGVAAIRRLAVIHPVVILADVSMPGRDGYEVCEFVKTSAELCLVPVLLIASDMEPFDDARGAQVGADGIVKKPFESHELISVVERFAEQFEAKAAVAAAPVNTPVAPVPIPNFAAFNESPYEAPTLVQQMPPDFSAVSEGVAFAEPAVAEAPGYFAEFQPTTMAAPFPEPQVESETAQEHAPVQEFVDTPPTSQTQGSVETPLVAEEPPAQGPLDVPLPTAASSLFPEGLEAPTAEPVFIEEQPSQTPEPLSSAPRFETLVFRAPAELAEPIWLDETVPSPPMSEPADPLAVEPQLEAEAPVASPDIPLEQPPEHPPTNAAVTATSLDSFSLDDATAGQVHFASVDAGVARAEVPYSLPTEDASATELATAENAAEAVPTEAAPLDITAEMVPTEAVTPAETYTEVAGQEAAPVVISNEDVAPQSESAVVSTEVEPPAVTSTEVSGQEGEPMVISTEIVAPQAESAAVSAEVSPPLVTSTEAAGPEVTPEVVFAEVVASETESEAVAAKAVPPSEISTEAAGPEVTSEVVSTAVVASEATPQLDFTAPAAPGTPSEAAPEDFPTEVAAPAAAPELISTEPVASETTSMEFVAPAAVPEVTYTEGAAPEVVPETVSREDAASEVVPEIASREIAASEVTPEAAPPAPPAAIAAPPQTFNWDLFYIVVHKAVVKMSPPALSSDVVGELVRRLADEIATEICSETSPPPT